MAAHKAATAVSLAPVAEKSGIALWVERYWKFAALLAVAIASVILYRAYTRSTERAENERAWEQLLAVAQEDSRTRRLRAEPGALEGVAAQNAQREAGAWALYIAATSAAERRDFAAARQAITELRQQHGGHALCTERLALPGSEGELTVVEYLEQRLAAQDAWKAANPTLFANPDPPADAPRVRLRTDRGDIVVALYSQAAPKHCENYLKLVREGYYNGTKFHRIIAGFMIQGGDPNSVQGEPTTWGQGGPGYKVEREENQLRHFPGFLAAAKQGNETESSGSQFYFTTASAHHLDGKHVVYGKIVEGMDVVLAIEKLPIAAGTSDRPEAPVSILAAEVLEG